MTARTLAPAARSTRARIRLLLPLTMALLVAGTGFLSVGIATRAYQSYGTGVAVQPVIAQLGLQIAAITLATAVLGLGMALGVTRPVRKVVEQLEALASGDLRGTLAITSTSELDSLGGAVNDAISAIQRYYLQTMTGAVITLDADGRVIGSSPAAEATLGYREEDLVGRPFSEVFAPAAGSRTSLAAIEAAIAGRKPVSVEDVEILAADGRPVRIGITASYLQQRNSDVIGVTIAFKDLNQMRRLRARLQRVGGGQPVKVNVRILASTNKDLERGVREGTFRDDLYFRLNVVSIHVPPLRERRDEIPELADHFLADANTRLKRRILRLAPDTLAALINYGWPGNVRELRTVIERAVVVNDGDVLASSSLPAPIRPAGPAAGSAARWDNLQNLTLDEKVAHLERAFVVDALVRAGAVQAAAARLLGVTERSVWHLVKKHRIDVARLKRDDGLGTTPLVSRIEPRSAVSRRRRS